METYQHTIAKRYNFGVVQRGGPDVGLCHGANGGLGRVVGQLRVRCCCPSCRQSSQYGCECDYNLAMLIMYVIFVAWRPEDGFATAKGRVAGLY